MSEEIDEEIGSDGDFSESEDEWTPQGTQPDSDSDFELNSSSSSKKKKKNNTKERKKRQPQERKSLKRKKPSTSLRDKLFNRYKPPPKPFASPKLTNPKLSSILEKSQYKKKQSIFVTPSNTQGDDGSSSSGDDHLVDPNDIDLASSFYTRKSIPNDSKTSTEPTASTSKLEESSDDDGDDMVDVNDQDNSDNESEEGTKKIEDSEDLRKLIEFAENLEKIKQEKKLIEDCSKKSGNMKTSNYNDVKISDLLNMGEEKQNIIHEPKRKHPKKKTKTADSDSDWEDVEDYTMAESQGTKRDDVQITVALPGAVHRTRTGKKVDVEAMLKRKLNRARKLLQVDMHQVSLLSFIAHGNYVNRILNDPDLWQNCLKLLPSKHCYPKEQTDKAYFSQITVWFHGLFKVQEDWSEQPNKSKQLHDILYDQMKQKNVTAKRYLVFIFVILLRALGLHARLVFNLPVIPIRPPESELYSFKTKKSEVTEEIEQKNDSKKKLIKSQKRRHSSIHKNIKKIVPQKNKDLTVTHSHSSKNKIDKKDDKPKVNDRKHKSSDNVKDKHPKIKETESVKKMKKEENTKTSKDKNSKELELKKKSSSHEKVKTRSKLNNEAISKVKEPIKAVKRISFALAPSDTDSSPHFRKIDANQTTKKISLRLRKKTDSDTVTNANPTVSSPKKRITRRLAAASVPQLDGADDSDSNCVPVKKPKLTKKPDTTKSSTSSGRARKISDEEFEHIPQKAFKKPENRTVNQLKTIDRRVFSSTDDDVSSIDSPKSKKSGRKKIVNFWVEVYCEKENKWLTIDVYRGKVDCVEKVKRSGTLPIRYVLAWNNDNSIKDVSPRYCSQLNTVTRKQRISEELFNEAISSFKYTPSDRDIFEDRELQRIHIDKPLPQTISEYKNHPLYALKRHLLKFEAIYPPNAVTLGFVRGEPVYARDCVYTLHSREIWVKQARVVKPGEKPYKIVTARPKWDRATNSVIKDQPLEIFGIWQTQDYEPPTAENGVVPRNAYGNVELFKACMLPKKTVHLQLPGLNRVCKKLNVDCAPAVVGFDFSGGGSYPVYDGFVVCEEFGELVTDAWFKDQEEAERKAEEKRLTRIHGNWKKLVKGLIIRERLEAKYNFKGRPE